MKTTVLQTNVQKHMAAFVMVAAMFFGIGMTLTAPQVASAQQNTAVENLDREGLIALIQQLLQQIMQRSDNTQSSVYSDSSGPVPAEAFEQVCPYSWTRNLKVGDVGNDVRELQRFLNLSEDTRVATPNASGGVGFESTYYGESTKAAVNKFQIKHRSEILSQQGLVNPTGVFGTLARSKMNSLCSSYEATEPQTITPTEDFFNDQVDEEESADEDEKKSDEQNKDEVAPEKNTQSCSRDNLQDDSRDLRDGQLVCLGVWDFGNAFGGDKDMCEDENGDGAIGCKIVVPACKSGTAAASRVFNVFEAWDNDDDNIDLMHNAKRGRIAERLGVSKSFFNEEMIRVWEYRCAASENDENEFDEDDVASIVSVSKTPESSPYTTTTYTITLESGRVIIIVTGSGLPAPNAPTLEALFEAKGFNGNFDELMDRVSVSDPEIDKRDSNSFDENDVVSIVSSSVSPVLSPYTTTTYTITLTSSRVVTIATDGGFLAQDSLSLEERLKQLGFNGDFSVLMHMVEEVASEKAKGVSQNSGASGGGNGDVRGASLTANEVYRELLARFTQ